MNRTSFLVDGFNLYHSLRTASDDLGGQSTKWLDLRSLLSSYLPVIGAGATLERIFYFSALAVHLDHRRPGVTARHRLYLECLRATGVIPELGRFKFKEVHCQTCNRDNPHYEEKETDVAISMKLVEILQLDEADTVVLVTGDTDLAPAVRTASKLFPTKQICFAFPSKTEEQRACATGDQVLLHTERAVPSRTSFPIQSSFRGDERFTNRHPGRGSESVADC